jgi:hypothetical protein
MEREEYIQRFGNHAGRIIEDYECKLCHRVLKCEGRSLNAHMRNCHKMGIIEYSRKYEEGRAKAKDNKSGGRGRAGKKKDGEDPHYENETYQIEVDNDEDDEDEDDETAAAAASAAHIVSVDDEEEEEEEDENNSSFDPLSNVETVDEELSGGVDVDDDDDEEEEDDDSDNDMEVVDEDDYTGESLDVLSASGRETAEDGDEEALEMKPDISEMALGGAAAPARGTRILQEILENPLIIPRVGNSLLPVSRDQEDLEEMDGDDDDIADYTEVYGVEDPILGDDDGDDDEDDDMEEVDGDSPAAAGGDQGKSSSATMNGDASGQATMFTCESVMGSSESKVHKKEVATL